MDKSERAEWHYNQNVLLSRIAAEMGRLFIPGHDRTQTEEYNQWAQAYRQAELEKEWFDWSDDRIKRDYTTCG